MRDFQSIQKATYDLVIIGGGVNGVGIARDAALRGLRTILIEKNDFASGTSSWSTRLIHGGLRYLEYFEFHLVRESLREREVLLHTAPHLVQPLQMTIPIYQESSREYWEIKAGMLLYDILSFDKTVPGHRMLRPQQFRQLFRAAKKDGLKGAAQYFDGQVEYAERLCLEITLDAKNAGATMLNYVAVTALERKNGAIAAIICQDQFTKETFTLDCSQAVVMNTSGPWVDEVCGLAEEGGESTQIVQERKIGGTKGSHIIVDPFPGAPTSALYVEAYADNRPYFIIPWLGKFIIGTTDHRYDEALDSVKASNDEIDYLISETNRVLPAAQLSRDDVRFTYSGVRPLPYVDDKKAGSITRNHILYDHTPDGARNLVSLIGGKLTTFRQVGEEMTDIAFKKLGKTAPDCPTLKRPLPGATHDLKPSLEKAIATYGEKVDRLSIQHLFGMYGSRAMEVLGLVKEAPELAERIVPYLPDIKAQAVYAVKSEMAYTLVDICRRRTAIAMLTDYGFDALSTLTATLAKHCGWSTAECDRQITQYRKYMEDNCIPDYCLSEQHQEQQAA